MSSAENLTEPMASSDRIASASAAFGSYIATIFSSTLPAVISCRGTRACPARDGDRDRWPDFNGGPYRAADQLGKLLRTPFLCDYFSHAEFRRELGM